MPSVGVPSFAKKGRHFRNRIFGSRSQETPLSPRSAKRQQGRRVRSEGQAKDVVSGLVSEPCTQSSPCPPLTVRLKSPKGSRPNKDKKREQKRGTRENKARKTLADATQSGTLALIKSEKSSTTTNTGAERKLVTTERNPLADEQANDSGCERVKSHRWTRGFLGTKCQKTGAPDASAKGGGLAGDLDQALRNRKTGDGKTSVGVVQRENKTETKEPRQKLQGRGR